MESTTSTSHQCATDQWQRSRRRRSADERKKSTFVGRKNAPSSFLLPFLASLVVGVLLIGSSPVVFAEEGNTVDSTPSTKVDSCLKAWVGLRKEDTKASQDLDWAHKAYARSMNSSMTGEEWNFGYTKENNDAYRTACATYNTSATGGAVFWTELESPAEFTCDNPQLGVTGKPTELYGMGFCLANTSDCHDVTIPELQEKLWDSIDMECTLSTNATVSEEGANAGDESEADLAKEENNGENDENKSDGGPTETADADTENLTPGDGSDSGDKLPFLSDEEVACIGNTTEFINKNPGLKAADDIYKRSQVLKMDEETGVELFGNTVEASKNMQTACELKKGHWVFFMNHKFVCVIEGMETISLHVHNVGSCLAPIPVCHTEQHTNLLRAKLVDLGYNCWEEGDTEDPSSSTKTSEGDNNVGSDPDNATSEANNGNASVKGEDDSEDGDMVADPESSQNTEDSSNSDGDGNGDGNGDVHNKTSEILDNMGMSESDQKCMSDNVALGMGHPELAQAIQEYSKSVDVKTIDVTDMSIGYSDESVNNLEAVCNNSAIGGYFNVITEKEFVCEMMSVKVNLGMTNLAYCMADTVECRSMDPLLLIEDLWQSMGLACSEKTEADEEDTTSSNADSTKSDQNDNKTDNDNNKPNEDDQPLNNNSLTESEATCMSTSSDFIDSSGVLVNATSAYQNSVKMQDPTKLGYPKGSASIMEQVCEDQGGIWSLTEAQNVTCKINGRDRCIYVYNFGGCIANTDDCQNLDPFVLVKGFFKQALKFNCRPECDQDMAWHNSSTAAPHKDSPTGQNNNLSAQKSSGSSPSSEGMFSSFTKAAIVLGVVVAIGFFGFFKYRASQRRETVVRSFEMAEITDLGFRTIT